jgi:uncharacterized protein (UPF0332 family)
MFDESEFLAVAHHLVEADAREGFQRSAISRAYYAAFLLARRVFREQGKMQQGGGGSDHRRIANLLDDLDPALAENYGALRRLRNEANYTTETVDPETLATTALFAISLADEIRDTLQAQG